jgi:hypothetical protein
MLYEDLSDKAKQKAYEEWVRNEPIGEWWDAVYDMAKEDGEEFGFRIDDIKFSGFWSQGDGACWMGLVDLNKWIESPECDLSLRCKMLMKSGLINDFIAKDVRVSCSRSNYFHSGTMDLTDGIEIYDASWGLTDGPLAGMSGTDWYEEMTPFLPDAHEALLKSVRGFADEIYKQLEKEYEYLTSEEQFIEMCDANEWQFTEEGEME